MAGMLNFVKIGKILIRPGEDFLNHIAIIETDINIHPTTCNLVTRKRSVQAIFQSINHINFFSRQC